jgi:hypothetical protein
MFFLFLIPKVASSNNFLNSTEARNYLRKKYHYQNEYIYRTTSNSIVNSFFNDIRSSSSGGALYYSSSTTSISVSSCCFCFVFSTNSGGAMYFYCSNLNLDKTSGYHCEVSSNYYGSFLYLYLYNFYYPSFFENCVVHGCPNQLSSYFSSIGPRSILHFNYGSLNTIFNFRYSNVSNNYHNNNYYHIYMYYFKMASIYFNTLTDNIIGSSSSYGFFYFESNSQIYLQFNNILRNSGQYSPTAMIYVNNGRLDDLNNYFYGNRFYYCLRAETNGIISLINSHFVSNYFSYLTIGSCNYSNTNVNTQSSQIFDVKCWLYYSIFSSDFKGAYENEIVIGSSYTSTTSLQCTIQGSSSSGGFFSSKSSKIYFSLLVLSILVNTCLLIYFLWKKKESDQESDEIKKSPILFKDVSKS